MKMKKDAKAARWSEPQTLITKTKTAKRIEEKDAKTNTGKKTKNAKTKKRKTNKEEDWEEKQVDEEEEEEWWGGRIGR